MYSCMVILFDLCYTSITLLKYIGIYDTMVKYIGIYGTTVRYFGIYGTTVRYIGIYCSSLSKRPLMLTVHLEFERDGRLHAIFQKMLLVSTHL